MVFDGTVSEDVLETHSGDPLVPAEVLEHVATCAKTREPGHGRSETRVKCLTLD